MSNDDGDRMTQISVPLSVEEKEIIKGLAALELRTPQQYIRRILRDALFAYGLLAKENPDDPRQAHTADPREAKSL